MSTSNATASSPPDPLYNDLITSLHTKLPQELYDQIEATVFEMVFLPGYLYFNVSGLKTSDTDAEKPANVARPELLCLSKDIHRRYAVRMWQENVCVVKAESGKVYEIVLVYCKCTSKRKDPVSVVTYCRADHTEPASPHRKSEDDYDT